MEAVAITGVNAAGIDPRLAGAPQVTLADQVPNSASLRQLLAQAQRAQGRTDGHRGVPAIAFASTRNLALEVPGPPEA